MLTALLSTIGPLLFGKAADVVVTATGAPLRLQRATKGLLKSKTFGAANLGLGTKLVGIFLLPLPPWIQYGLVLAAVIEWGTQIYLRIITHEKV